MQYLTDTRNPIKETTICTRLSKSHFCQQSKTASPRIHVLSHTSNDRIICQTILGGSPSCLDSCTAALLSLFARKLSSFLLRIAEGRSLQSIDLTHDNSRSIRTLILKLIRPKASATALPPMTIFAGHS